MSELDNAKVNLYHLLLMKKVEELTDIEIDVMYRLVEDRAIQDVLQRAKDEEKRLKNGSKR